MGVFPLYKRLRFFGSNRNTLNRLSRLTSRSGNPVGKERDSNREARREDLVADNRIRVDV